MAKISILIIEDDVEQLATLDQTLNKFGYAICGKATTLVEALGLYYATQPDIVLSDIYLGVTPDGITFAQRIAENLNTARPIIFLTQHADMETFQQAKLTGPYNYLIKPYNPLELQFAIELALEKFMNAPGLFSNGNNIGALRDKQLYVKKGNSIYKLNSSDIHVVKVDGKYCNISSDQGEFLVQQPLKKMEEQLVPLGFIRVHRNYLVNGNSVSKIHIGDSQVILKGGKTIPFSQSYRDQLTDRMQVIK